MKLVIDIPEVFYEALKKSNEMVSGQRSGKTLMSVIFNAVASGTPLPNAIANAPTPKTDALDKIRAEILEEKECAYADFERYKVEYLGQDWEDALDSLPQDDFRYGMERCIEILDRYRAESEEKI